MPRVNTIAQGMVEWTIKAKYLYTSEFHDLAHFTNDYISLLGVGGIQGIFVVVQVLFTLFGKLSCFQTHVQTDLFICVLQVCVRCHPCFEKLCHWTPTLDEIVRLKLFSGGSSWFWSVTAKKVKNKFKNANFDAVIIIPIWLFAFLFCWKLHVFITFYPTLICGDVNMAFPWTFCTKEDKTMEEHT